MLTQGIYPANLSPNKTCSVLVLGGSAVRPVLFNVSLHRDQGSVEEEGRLAEGIVKIHVLGCFLYGRA